MSFCPARPPAPNSSLRTGGGTPAKLLAALLQLTTIQPHTAPRAFNNTATGPWLPPTQPAAPAAHTTCLQRRPGSAGRPAGAGEQPAAGLSACTSNTSRLLPRPSRSRLQVIRCVHPTCGGAVDAWHAGNRLACRGRTVVDDRLASFSPLLWLQSRHCLSVCLLHATRGGSALHSTNRGT